MSVFLRIGAVVGGEAAVPASSFRGHSVPAVAVRRRPPTEQSELPDIKQQKADESNLSVSVEKKQYSNDDRIHGSGLRVQFAALGVYVLTLKLEKLDLSCTLHPRKPINKLHIIFTFIKRLVFFIIKLHTLKKCC